MFYRRKSFLVRDNAKVVLKLLTITERILWEILVVYFQMILAYNLMYVCMYIRLPWWLSGQESVCTAADARDMGSTPGSERSPGGGNGNLLHILAWRIPWTEEPGGLQFMGSLKVRDDLATKQQQCIYVYICVGFSGGSEVKASACNAGDPGSIPGSGRSPGKGNGNPLQYSCLENPMDGGAW